MTMIERANWFSAASRDDCWLVGVSGGADSVALLHLLAEQGFRELVVCHLDHGLRGEESAGDAEFVEKLAAELGFPCEIGRADVPQLMAQRGESMETAARNARHAFFAECAEKFHCPRILLAHHADDQAETVLWNLLRGSRGLKGMREVQRFTTESGAELEFIRPLLLIHHSELVAWLNLRGKCWREDASNAEALVTRNRLRHEVMPLLDEISGRNAARMIDRALDGVRDLEEIEAWAVNQAAALDPQGRLHLPVLRTLPTALQGAIVTTFLRNAEIGGIDRELVSRILCLFDPASAPAVNLPGGGSVRRRAGRLVIELLKK